MSARGELLSLSVPGGQKEIAAFWFARGVSSQADTMLSNELNFSVAVHVYNVHVSNPIQDKGGGGGGAKSPLPVFPL